MVHVYLRLDVSTLQKPKSIQVQDGGTSLAQSPQYPASVAVFATVSKDVDNEPPTCKEERAAAMKDLWYKMLLVNHNSTVLYL